MKCSRCKTGRMIAVDILAGRFECETCGPNTPRAVTTSEKILSGEQIKVGGVAPGPAKTMQVTVGQDMVGRVTAEEGGVCPSCNAGEIKLGGVPGVSTLCVRHHIQPCNFCKPYLFCDGCDQEFR